jgi:hypothetical protein
MTEKESERYRTALREIADPLLLKMPGYVGTELALRLIQHMQQIAKDALETNRSDKENECR